MAQAVNLESNNRTRHIFYDLLEIMLVGWMIQLPKVNTATL